ncbi:MAG: gluconate 2-dehydrogenase subunit 3 family protein [Bacteroidetes bacterium]|nr:gluconate 2-dehydrogenase subunit 3 family protein [Bacteroidota bacterium]MBS1933330.1 gluconate 2-dehydrogenase subunit 3 family protein [Bacteroidota bacterium]
MNRREALSSVALLLGGTIVGAEAFLSGCKIADKKMSTADFTPENIAFLDEVGETILPATASSPGAKEAKIGEFMKTIVTDCYEDADHKIFMEGIGKLNDASKAKFSKDFMDLTPEQKHDLLVTLDTEAKDYKKQNEGNKDAPKHYFALMKQLTVWGYFTSKPGATQALRYIAVPGKYEGCIPYKKGDKAWAT